MLRKFSFEDMKDDIEAHCRTCEHWDDNTGCHTYTDATLCPKVNEIIKRYHLNGCMVYHAVNYTTLSHGASGGES